MNKIEEAIKEADDLTQEAGVIVKGGKIPRRKCAYECVKLRVRNGAV